MHTCIRADAALHLSHARLVLRSVLLAALESLDHHRLSLSTLIRKGPKYSLEREKSLDILVASTSAPDRSTDPRVSLSLFLSRKNKLAENKNRFVLF